LRVAWIEIDVTQLSKPDAKNGVPTQTARFVGTARMPSANLELVCKRSRGAEAAALRSGRAERRHREACYEIGKVQRREKCVLEVTKLPHKV